jgi:hypothetical protein
MAPLLNSTAGRKLGGSEIVHIDDVHDALIIVE